jgi:hypothetical protein
MTKLHNINVETLQSVKDGLDALSENLLSLSGMIGDNSSKITINSNGDVVVQDSDLIVNQKLGIGVSKVTDSVDFEVVGPIKFQGKKQEVRNDIPTTGLYNIGDIVWSDAPKPNGNLGWICIRTGTPGEWRPFGSIGG